MKINADIPSYNSKEFQNRFFTSDDSIFGRKEAIKIFKIQDVIHYLKFPLPLHRTNYYDIMFIARGGQASRHCGLKNYEIGTAQILFKAAGQITSGDVISKDIEGYFCMVEEDFISSNGSVKNLISAFPFFKYGNNPIISLSATEVEKFNFLLNNIHQSYNSTDKGKNLIIAAYLNVLLQEAAAIHQLQNNNAAIKNATTAEAITSKFKDLVAEHYLSKRQVKEYADLLFVTPNHLNKVIKNTTGTTAHDLIFEMLMMEAQILLKQTNMSIAEIAIYLSFEDTSYFTRFFRKQTGITPGAYRKME
jgi:AraC family transcriptional activator of pobA